MTQSKMTFTKAIRGGKLRATEMEVGASVTGVLLGFKQSQYGDNILMNVNGKEVEIYAAGNLKFLPKDVAAGKRMLNTFTVVTRQPNKDIKGRSTSQFSIVQDDSAETSAASVVAVAAETQTTSLKARLKEIQTKTANSN
jgi:predicted fused transcriptional regulator/phosphomethylpyrimidine kinase